jgi:hypothetical protein
MLRFFAQPLFAVTFFFTILISVLGQSCGGSAECRTRIPPKAAECCAPWGFLCRPASGAPCRRNEESVNTVSDYPSMLPSAPPAALVEQQLQELFEEAEIEALEDVKIEVDIEESASTVSDIPSMLPSSPPVESPAPFALLAEQQLQELFEEAELAMEVEEEEEFVEEFEIDEEVEEEEEEYDDEEIVAAIGGGGGKGKMRSKITAGFKSGKRSFKSSSSRSTDNASASITVSGGSGSKSIKVSGSDRNSINVNGGDSSSSRSIKIKSFKSGKSSRIRQRAV